MITPDPQYRNLSHTGNAEGVLKDASDPKPELSVVVPCYNEQQGIEELVRRCCLAARSTVGESFELILIDDGSSDDTWNCVSKQIQASPRLVGIKLSRNHGHQIALTAGLAAVRGKLVFVLDADLQDPPELLKEFMDAMQKHGADVVYGQRISRAGETWFKSWTANVFYRVLAYATKAMIPVDAGDFRLMTRRVSDLIVQMPEQDRFIRGMVAWVGFRQVALPYDRLERFAGSTKYPFSKMLRFAIDAFLGYSMLLLRFSAVMALCLLIALVGIALNAIYAWFFLDAVPGWTSTVLLIVFVSMAQLTAISIVGEYVGRIYLSTKNRPLFIVDVVERGRDQ